MKQHFTYAEVKALATGEIPTSKGKRWTLIFRFQKLKLMKANHTSQKYRLEDNIAKALSSADYNFKGAYQRDAGRHSDCESKPSGG